MTQEVAVTIIGIEGVRPIRVLGREVEIQGDKVSVRLNQLYSEQEKYILLELEIPSKPAIQQQIIASVAVVYRHLGAQITGRLSQQIVATFTHFRQSVKAETQVMTAVMEQLAVIQNKRAVQLRDAGYL